MLKNILFLIPARSGSKGIAGKNTRYFAGKPLLAWTAEIATGLAKEFDGKAILSTDSEEIARVGRDFGLEVPFLRSAELAQDETPMIPVILDAIDKLGKNTGFEIEHIILLQPTSPLRRREHVLGALELYINSAAEAVVAVRRMEDRPEWAFKLDQNRKLIPCHNGKLPVRRQELQDMFCLNGAIYITPVAIFREKQSFILPTTVGYVMDRIASIDIDDEFDWKIAEYFKLQGGLKW